ncbi:hypothetical protein DM785_16450 (plasmid) [Deinococcus actinosclerus]|nr:hypothetical protein DM785_16450 [Deinococcus actinosclerus]
MNRTDWLNHLHALPEGENLTESPTELALHRTLLKYLAVGGVFAAGAGITSGRLYPQVHLLTRGGAFRADFLLVAGSQITLIECDGASFHTDPFDDHLRSAFIFEAGLVDQVIRFNGTMLHHSPHDAALWTSVVAPAAFWAEAEAKLRRAATPEGVQAVDRLRHELNQGYSSFDYSVSTEDTELSAFEEGASRRADFSGLYHNGQPNKTRAGELIDTLRRCDATNLEGLERTYWAEVKDRNQAAVAELREAAHAKPDRRSLW